MLGSGSPSAGTPYLLPAFAAAFLGATQLKHGRFNAGGTLIAVLLLGTGVTGLALANAPQWAGDMFVGVVLIAALALTGLQRRSPSDPTVQIPATGGVAHASQRPGKARRRARARRHARRACGSQSMKVRAGGSAARRQFRRGRGQGAGAGPRRHHATDDDRARPRRSASRSRRARRSSSSAVASRPARSRATSSSRARRTWAGPPRDRDRRVSRAAAERIQDRPAPGRRRGDPQRGQPRDGRPADPRSQAEGRGLRHLLQHRIGGRRDPRERRRQGEQRADRREARGRDRGRQQRQGEHGVREHHRLRDPAGARRPVREHVQAVLPELHATRRSTSR